MKKHMYLFISVALVILLIISGCSNLLKDTSTPTKDLSSITAKYEEVVAKYRQIKTDMDYDEVEKIMGQPGELVSNKDAPEVPYYYDWRFDKLKKDY